MIKNMRLVVVIPTHNEEIVIADNVRKLAEWLESNLAGADWRIVIADNGSTDGTLEICRELAATDPRVGFWHTDVSGRGSALRQAWSEAKEADILAYMDADLSVGLEAVGPLVSNIRGGADLAVGSRFAPGARVDRSILREISSRVYAALAKNLLRIKINDLQCGFKAIRCDAFRKLYPYLSHPGWFFDTELIVLAECAGMKITEIPVDWVEHRDRRRKSSVKMMSTVADYLGDIWAYRRRLPRIRARLQAEMKPEDQAPQDQ
ncbi:hypothetical protein A3F28_01385 [Candidatus Uhrbacteria bacterium RIFCSPHIGHO2_12_FULL_57_11]|uniref:Glycosyltransferase 2-like domain-containing protein n=1 Tax=Candidatus Uhrbacteria bacterium RIFCSPHIGHO2_12_FULL_57_11 TaxID=1802398 RepID=A0A1F7UN53_9BACT|nr:MAG: hypothetical protein A3F28_01385 [Candidatus Uhrbacteria bacterium RIFCSPHIGHO2_12_FULL_57_11]